MKQLFYFLAGVNIVHIAIQDNLEHHLGMVRTTDAFFIQLPGHFKIKTFDQSINHTHRIIGGYIFIDSLWKK